MHKERFSMKCLNTKAKVVIIMTNQSRGKNRQ